MKEAQGSALRPAKLALARARGPVAPFRGPGQRPALHLQIDAADTLVGVFLHDNFARATKRSGAWMSAFRRQSRGVLPIIVNNNNFAGN